MRNAAYREDIVNYLRENKSACKEEIKGKFSGNNLDIELDLLVHKSGLV